MVKRKRTKKATLHREPKLEQHEPHKKNRVKLGAWEGKAVLALLMVILMLSEIPWKVTHEERKGF